MPMSGVIRPWMVLRKVEQRSGVGSFLALKVHVQLD
jgi:hypothetical protein